MAWVKVPAEHHEIFHAALPRDRRITTLRMFGSIAALVNGHMFGGLFGRSAIVKLAESDQAEAMRIDGSEPFDPMGTGRVMSNTVLLGPSVIDEPAELRDWFQRAFDYVSALPPKKAKKLATKKPAAPARRAAASASRPAAKRAATGPARPRRAAPTRTRKRAR